VGILSGIIGNDVPRKRHGRVPDPYGEALPQTRYYIGREEVRLRNAETNYSVPLRLAGE
jgi:hypothetical protein